MQNIKKLRAKTRFVQLLWLGLLGVISASADQTITGNLTVTGNLATGGVITGSVTATGSTTARTLADKSAEVYNVKDYGAVGNGTTDDTAAFAAVVTAVNAAGRGSVYIPRGAYKLSPNSLAFSGKELQVRGAGVGATYLSFTGTDGDCLTFSSGGRTEIADFSCDRSAGDSISDGSLIKMTSCQQFFIHDVTLLGGYNNMTLDGCWDGFITNVHAESGANWTGSTKIGSSSLLLTRTGSDTCHDLRFSGCTFRGNTSNYYCDYGIKIDALDGAWFSNCGTGFCQTGISLYPTSTTYPMTGLQLTNFSCDTVGSFHFYAGTPASYTGVFGGHKISTGYFFNSLAHSFYWDVECSVPDELIMTGVTFSTIATNPIWIPRGRSLSFSDLIFTRVCTGGSAYACVMVSPGAGKTVYDLRLNNLSFEKYDSETPSTVVLLFPSSGTIDRVLINGINNKGATNSVVAQSGTGKNISVANVVSDESWTCASASVIYPLLGQSVFSVSGTTTITAINGLTAYKGRVITLLFSSSLTVQNSSGFALKGGVNMSAVAGSSLTMTTLDGVNWQEIGRSL